MENVEKDFDDMIINTGRPSYVDENVTQETAANYVTLKKIILTSSIKRWM
jgi:hypothetical protein